MTTAAELRSQADRLDALAELEEAARSAKLAYRADTSDPALRDAHRQASQALADARQAMRVERDAAVVVQAETVSATSSAGLEG